MLLADDKGAELIVAVGTHATLVEFLDKGRSGMASTFLTRLRVGSKLVDAKGVSRLYRNRISNLQLTLLVLAGLLALGVALASTAAGQTLIGLLGARIDDITSWVGGLFGGMTGRRRPHPCTCVPAPAGDRTRRRPRTVIDFRYHIVSLISVFLALAVGIALGAGPLKETIGDTLTGQVEQLRGEKDALRAELDDDGRRPAGRRDVHRRRRPAAARRLARPTAASPSSRSARSTRRPAPRSTSGSAESGRDASPRTSRSPRRGPTRTRGRSGRRSSVSLRAVPRPGARPTTPASRRSSPPPSCRRSSRPTRATRTCCPTTPSVLLELAVVERERQPAGDRGGPGDRARRRDRRPRRAARRAGRGRDAAPRSRTSPRRRAARRAERRPGAVVGCGARRRTARRGQPDRRRARRRGPGRDPDDRLGHRAWSPGRSTCRSRSPAGSPGPTGTTASARTRRRCRAAVELPPVDRTAAGARGHGRDRRDRTG